MSIKDKGNVTKKKIDGVNPKEFEVLKEMRVWTRGFNFL